MYNSPDTYNLHYNDTYAFNASTSGIEIYDVDTESVIKYVSYYTTHSGADADTITSVWASPTEAYLGTTNSGIYTLNLDYITSVSGVIDLASYLVPFKWYPDITNNHITYIHGAGDYLCITTISGVDHFNLGHSDAYYRSYTTTAFATKCHQTSKGRFYYIISGCELSTSAVNTVYTHQCDWDENSIGYIYDVTASGSLFYGAGSINDIYIVENTSTYKQNNNLIFAATQHGVVLIEERPGDEANSRYKHYLVEA